MTTPKIASQVTEAVADMLADHAERLYKNLGSTVVAVVELKSARRDQPAADENKAPVVWLKLVTCEIATGAHEGQVRNVQEALYRARTARGTLDEVAAAAAHQTIEHAAAVALETPFQPAEDPDEDADQDDYEADDADGEEE